METIKNYLESMFAGLPNTAEVKRAKDELYSMMEDKYQELISEGKNENEAVGIVISEFGNLDDLAETLGLENVIGSYEEQPTRRISLDEAKQFISDTSLRHFAIGLGTFLCITSPVGCILGSLGGDIVVAIGLCFLFVMIACAVGLFIFSGAKGREWTFLQKEPCSIDYATADYVHNEQEMNKAPQILMLAVGIALCVMCAVPVIIMSLIPIAFLSECVGPSLLLTFVGLGVMLIISSSGRSSAYRRLLSLNDRSTMAGNYESVKSADRYAKDDVFSVIRSAYWPTITCVYLIWSFLTFNWFITWIIWPIAGVVSKVIDIAYDNTKGGE